MEKGRNLSRSGWLCSDRDDEIFNELRSPGMGGRVGVLLGLSRFGYSCGVEVRVKDVLVRNVTVRAVTTITKATVTIYLNNVGGMVMVVQ